MFEGVSAPFGRFIWSVSSIERFFESTLVKPSSVGLVSGFGSVGVVESLVGSTLISLASKALSDAELEEPHDGDDISLNELLFTLVLNPGTLTSDLDISKRQGQVQTKSVF